MRIQELAEKLVNFTKNEIDKIIRNIEENKRQDIAKDFESTVKFLMSRNKKGHKGLNWLDELKYLDRNPFVDVIEDLPTMFTKGREHIIKVHLVQSNYRIKRDGTIFIVDNDKNDEYNQRCRSYIFSYSYYNNNDTPDTQVRLHYYGFSIDTNFKSDKKTLIVDKV